MHGNLEHKRSIQQHQQINTQKKHQQQQQNLSQVQVQDIGNEANIQQQQQNADTKRHIILYSFVIYVYSYV